MTDDALISPVPEAAATTGAVSRRRESVRPRFSTIVAAVGLGLAALGVYRMFWTAGLISEHPDVLAVAVWALVFLLGIFLFGIGLGRRMGGAARF